MAVKGLKKTEAQALFNRFNNLKAGGGRRTSKPLVIQVDAGGVRDNYFQALIRGVEEVDKGLRITTLSMTRRIGQLAKANLERSILRPGEHFHGKGRRQTGNFTFGTRPKGQGKGGGGGAFVAVNLEGDNQVGFGYPDIQQADDKTDRVWRTLEWGIGPRGMDHPESPRGEPKLPQRFGFTGPNPATSRLMVLQGPAVAQGAIYVQMFKTKQRRKNVRKKKPVTPQGQAPKLFITRAIDEMAGIVPSEYRRVVAETYRKL